MTDIPRDQFIKLLVGLLSLSLSIYFILLIILKEVSSHD